MALGACCVGNNNKQKAKAHTSYKYYTEPLNSTVTHLEILLHIYHQMSDTDVQNPIMSTVGVEEVAPLPELEGNSPNCTFPKLLEST